MNNYDDEYFFIQKSDGHGFPSLTPNEDTVERKYSFEIQSNDLSPFVFFNGAKDYLRKIGVTAVKSPPEILFDGTDLVVTSAIREKLVDMNIPGLYIHPTVYIGDDGSWHEDYWFLSFPIRFDCWDREKSDFSDTVLDLGGFKLHSVYTYSLDAKLLNDTPLEQRLLFKLGGTLDAYIVCHKSIARLFRGNGANGAKLVRIADF
ncbi:hypothetical protein GTP81_28020 [Rugamonas sp. FT107W]|uniref:Immunity MXAN-0049 protein domain-containing protein n=1 Tax=Duganella vulcania TaxID=2692166 RepID=A0A845HUX0_9BURK|nr:hypothetical protein [Duganella vulcania]MYN20594.1 hypothetical protein [Duganella vulcania]